MQRLQIGVDPNVGLVLSPGETLRPDLNAGNNYGMPRLLLKFLQLVAPKYPQHTFSVLPSSLGAGSGRVEVVCGGHNLGSVRDNGGRLHLYNRRIDADVKRGDRTIKTKLIRTAVSSFAKYFQPMTPKEFLSTEAGGMSQALDSAYTAERNAVKKLNNMLPFLFEHLVENWPELSKGIPTTSYRTRADIDKIPTVLAEAAVSGGVYRSYKDMAGYEVCIKDGTYYAQRRDDKSVCVYTTDTLPMRIKQGVGMLKLVPDRTYISDVGFKKDNAHFYVLTL